VQPTRIAFIGPDYPDSLESNLARAATRMGMTAEVLPYLSGQGPGLAKLRRVASKAGSYERFAQSRFLSANRKEYDVIVVLTGASARFLPTTVEELKQRADKVVCWFVDSVLSLGRGNLFRCTYDAAFFAERHLVKLVNGYTQTPAYLLPEGHDKEWHAPRPDIAPTNDVVVVGNYPPLRVRLLERLASAGVPLRLYGNPLPRYAGSLSHLHTGLWLSGREKAKVFQGASAVLNTMHEAHVDIANCRLFEATASGAVVVTEGRPLIREIFQDQVELVIYDDFAGMLEGLDKAISAPEQFAAMRAAAASRSASRSLDARLTQLLATVGGYRA
jgi:spore maturation protein CgeB